MVVLYILLFVLSLSILIMIHEMGHLLTAKMFKVYCFEYAIGFGPKLVSFKRKNGETTFSLRAIPFGGFVSMYGESETVPEGMTIDPSRSLLSIKRWKRAIIMVAGVTMNFLLAIVVFFVYEIAFPAYSPRYSHVTINNNSKAYEVGLRSGDFLYSTVATPEDRSYVFYDTNALLTYSDNTTRTAYFGFDYGSLTYKDTSLINRTVAYENKEVGSLNITTFEEVTVNDIIAMSSADIATNYKTTGFISAFGLDKENKRSQYLLTNDFGGGAKILVEIPYDTDDQLKDLSKFALNEQITVIGNIDIGSKAYHRLTVKNNNFVTHVPDFYKGNLLEKVDGTKLDKISFNVYRVDENDLSGKGKQSFAINDIAFKKDGNKFVLTENIGFNMQIDQNYHNFGEAFQNTFVDFGEAGSIIFRSLGMLLTDANSWKEVGGIVAMGAMSTQLLQDFGFGQFLRLMALISVNLGIVNLLPFPGLDGWQLLVVAVEGISRKEIPAKVKNIVSIIGIALLFALMIIILVKDIIALF